jgi:hypothetical protein
MFEGIFDRIGTGHDEGKMVCKRRWASNPEKVFVKRKIPRWWRVLKTCHVQVD